MQQNVNANTRPHANAQRFEEREPVIFENEGQKIFGMLHRPLNSTKCPIVVMCHGFAGNKIGKYRIYILLAQKLAQMGIATLRFDFRGSGESEGDFSDLTIENEVSDTLKALEFCRKNPSFDAERIGILGNSFGGAVAVLAARQNGHIKSMALLAPLFDSAMWRKKWESLVGSPEDVSQKELSRIMEGNVPGPLFYPSFFKLNIEKDLSQLQKIPLLHVCSERDDRVGMDHYENYKRCRQNAPADTKWIRFQKSDHDFSNLEERKMLVEETARWFSETL